jgi:transcriptional antiterminator NusG
MRLVTSSSKVLKFLGGKEPVALSKKEVEKIISNMKGEVIVSSTKPEFTEGSEIEIASGPFAGFVGIIDKVDSEAEKLTVMVSIFGRLTPVELSFDQVKR